MIFDENNSPEEIFNSFRNLLKNLIPDSDGVDCNGDEYWGMRSYIFKDLIIYDGYLYTRGIHNAPQESNISLGKLKETPEDRKRQLIYPDKENYLFKIIKTFYAEDNVDAHTCYNIIKNMPGNWKETIGLLEEEVDLKYLLETN